MIWNSCTVYWFPVLCMHVHVCVTRVSVLQVRLRQLAEIQVFPWMAVATGKGGSLVTLWPSLVILDMNCRGRAESPAFKWKIDTTGNPALQAASVRERAIVWVRERWGGAGDRERYIDWWREREKHGSVGDQSERGMERGRGSKGGFLLTACSKDYNSLSMVS